MRPLYVPDFIRNPEPLYEHLEQQAPWMQMERTPRRECFMALDESLTYSYGNNNDRRGKVFQASRMLSIVTVMMETLNVMYGTAYNVAVGNLYADQHQHLGWHADDSPEQDPLHPIAVVSFGAAREIWVKARTAKGEVPPEDRFLLEPGSLFIMPPGFQDVMVHRIPKHPEPCGPRLSLTFRKLDRSVDAPAGAAT
jgi:alkylated DNA repair dioxygenase AlkB